MLYFLDFEASSLRKAGYPIEAGWVDETGAAEEHLIRPAPTWTDWDEEAAAIHRISRETLLREAEPHDAVASRMMSLLSGQELFATAPSWDGKWLSMLLRAAGIPRHALRLRDSDIALADAARARLGPAADQAAITALLAKVRSDVEHGPPAHRALADARTEWEVWRRLR